MDQEFLAERHRPMKRDLLASVDPALNVEVRREEVHATGDQCLRWQKALANEFGVCRAVVRKPCQRALGTIHARLHLNRWEDERDLCRLEIEPNWGHTCGPSVPSPYLYRPPAVGATPACADA